MVPLSSLIAGPIVRRVEAAGASVWLALSKAAEVRLSIFDAAGECVAAVETPTRAVGTGLHLALATARGAAPLAWGQTYEYEILLDGEALDTRELVYEGGPARPSFVVPGARPETTHILHGSCRHPTNRGPDALGLLDARIGNSVTGEQARPQLFVCSGDLVYADSPSPSFSALLSDVGRRLQGSTVGLYQDAVAEALEAPAEHRGQFAEKHAQVYAGPARQLFGFGEYLALHLLSLSPSAWPENIPEDLQDFFAGLSSVRRALANCAFYAVFDDHEVTDDWYLTRAWSERVLQASLGRAMIAHGLLAFALVHSWGNDPSQWEEGQAGASLLALLGTGALGGEAERSETERLLGMPESVGRELTPSAGALRWHVRLKTPAVDLRGLDTRTMRSFPSDDPHAIPDLLSPRGISEQLSDWGARPIVVVPSPFAPPPRTKTERAIAKGLAFLKGKPKLIRDVYGPDRGDDWAPESECFARVLEALGDSWVCLGGDTHLSYAAQVHSAHGSGAIFCSSGMKRETAGRRLRQRMGFGYPWPWRRPPRIVAGDMVMQYLEGRRDDGAEFQYFSENSIGELVLTETGAVHHVLWHTFRGSMRGVRHEPKIEV